MKVLKLGTMVEDTVTKTKGMLVLFILHIGGNKEYIYQPRGLNPENGQPVEKIWLQEERIKGGEFEEIDVPEILGTKAEDIATGFKGTITSLVYHLNGCLHVTLKPEGINKMTGNTIMEGEFDIRRVKGPKIKPLEGKKLAESKKKTPSPIAYNARVPR